MLPDCRYVSCLLFIIFSFNLSQAQVVEDSLPLRDAFQLLESQYSCTFSYKDVAISNHRIELAETASLEEALDNLEQNSLFNYTLLQDLTVAVSSKQSVITICGTLVDDKTNPFQDVSVVTPYQNLSTNPDGYFEAQVLFPDQSVSISYTGYEPRKFRAQELLGRPCRRILLLRKIEQLQQIFLSNYISKGITKNLDGSLSIDYGDFDILPGLIEPDVLQTIQALPGIQSVNETVSFINIRGGTNDQNLILLDGVKMYQSGHFFGLISAFNPFLTEKVSVIKNGSPSSYGDGVSGIIAMEGNPDVNSEFTAGAGTNLISADAYLDVPLGSKASLQVAARGSINGLVETPTFNAYFDKVFQNTEVITNSESQSVSDDAFNFVDGYARLLLQPTENDYIRVNFLVLENNLEFLENAMVDNITISRRSNLEQENFSGGVYWRKRWNDPMTTEFQFYGSSYNLRANNVDVINNQELTQENEVLETGFKANANYRISERLIGILGYQFNETGITNFEEINNPFFQRTDKQVIRTNSLFAQATVQSKDNNTTLSLGLRANHIGKFDEILIEPRLSFSHRFRNYFSVELLGEFKSQTTSQIIDFQNDFLGVENRRWVLSVPGVIPIVKGKQLSAGFTYNRNGWQMTLEPYIKYIDGISSQSQGFQNQYQNVRTNGSYLVKGIDLLLDKRFKNVNTWLSYSFADNTYKFDELAPSEFHNNIDITHTLTYGINYSWNDFTIAGGVNWHSGKPTTTPVEGNEIVDGEVNFNPPNNANIDDYVRVDVSATYSFTIGKKVKAFTGISIWNLLDTNNVVNNFYRVNASGNLEEVNERALAFTPNASFRVTF